jgi:hypothetical protein
MHGGLRVHQEGDVGAGDTVELAEKSDGLTVRELWHLVCVDKGNIEAARLALHCQTLAPEWREPLEERLRQELLIPAGTIHSARNIGKTTARWLYGYKHS